MIRRRWPSSAVCARAATNPPRPSRSVQNIDWTILDGCPAADQFPTVADLAQIWLVIQDGLREGDAP